MMMVYLFHFFRIRYRQHKLKTILSAGLIIFISAITIVFSPAGNRVSEALKVIRHPDKAASLQESTASRLLAWKTAWQIAHDYFPLGTGTGDIKEVTLAYYEKSGYQWPLYYKLNAHNQFLQSFAALGIAGSGALICILWLPVFFRKTDDLPTVIFPVLLFINFLFESMLEVQNGVMMITAFYVFFASFPAKNSGK
jgi:O-antigen ligase